MSSTQQIKELWKSPDQPINWQLATQLAAGQKLDKFHYQGDCGDWTVNKFAVRVQFLLDNLPQWSEESSIKFAREYATARLQFLERKEDAIQLIKADATRIATSMQIDNLVEEGQFPKKRMTYIQTLGLVHQQLASKLQKLLEQQRSLED